MWIWIQIRIPDLDLDLDPDPDLDLDLDLDLDFGPWILDPGFVRLSSFLKKPVPSDSQFLKVKFLKVLVWCIGTKSS